MSASNCDVLVAGAGPAGATLARLLALRGLNVLLIDPGLCMTKRLEMVAPSSLSVFAASGAAPLLDNPAIAQRCLGIRRRWGMAGAQTEEFLRHPGGCGFAIDRLAFDSALRAMAKDAGVIPVTARVVGAWRCSDKTICRLAVDGRLRTMFARVAIDATGRPAALAHRMGARQIVHDRVVATMESRGVVAQVCPWLRVNDHDGGWTYSLDGPGRQRETWRVLRSAADRRRRIGVNASAMCLSRASGAGWIAVGDAACAFDPIASQGLFHAVSTALIAAGIILSGAGVTDQAATYYSAAVRSAFTHSESGRAAVYRALTEMNAPFSG